MHSQVLGNYYRHTVHGWTVCSSDEKINRFFPNCKVGPLSFWRCVRQRLLPVQVPSAVVSTNQLKCFAEQFCDTRLIFDGDTRRYPVDVWNRHTSKYSRGLSRSFSAGTRLRGRPRLGFLAVTASGSSSSEVLECYRHTACLAPNLQLTNLITA